MTANAPSVVKPRTGATADAARVARFVAPTLPLPVLVEWNRGPLSPVAPSDLASVSMLSTIALVWSVVALVLVGWLVVGTISVCRIVADARELTSPD